MSRVAQEIIIKPVITEKATMLKEEGNQVVFQVARDANKVQIRRAVEELFGVKVVSVRTEIAGGKWKRRGMSYGKRPNWKKAIVRLSPNSELDLLAMA